VKHVLSMLKSQPVAESLGGPLIFNDDGRQTLTTTILGMRVEVGIGGSETILIAECILGSLEAFFATVIGQQVVPHTELFRITVTQSEHVREPLIKINKLDMAATITWPRGLSITRFDQHCDVRQFFFQGGRRCHGRDLYGQKCRKLG
jgi:hypothetical protein